MRVAELMTREVHAVGVGESADRAARIMWERDCGSVPVVDAGGHVVGMITDRDACMAAYTSGRPLDRIPVAEAMSRELFACRPEDLLEDIERTLWARQLRRLPVVDASGRLLGILSLADLARHVGSTGGALEADATRVALTLAAISEPPARRFAAE
jgi:CBS domain-containing protein